MLALTAGSGWSVDELRKATPEIFKAAELRKGDWVVHRPIMEHRWLWLGQPRCRWVNVHFTDKEFASLYHILEHGMSTQAKPTMVLGSMVMEAKRLWPDGTLEHMAMKQIGVSVMMSLMRGHFAGMEFSFRRLATMLMGLFLSYRNRRSPVKVLGIGSVCAVLLLFIVKESSRTHYRRCTKREVSAGLSRVPAERDTGGASAGLASGCVLSCDPSGEPPDRPDPGPDQLVPPPGLGPDQKEVALAQTGSTARDLEVLQGADETLRILGEDGMVKVVGREYDKSTDRYPIVGVQTGPCSEPPLVYCNSFNNVEAAVHHRLELTAKPCKWTRADRDKWMGFARAACHGKHAVFSKARVRTWITANWDFEAIKSGKWSYTRLQASLENLCRQSDPEFRLSAAIKAEVMPTGKAPRLLIADGDDGQLMALMTVRCFEDILFEHFEEKSIKHLPKREAVDRCVGALEPPTRLKDDSGAIEGDGKAWDATLNALIRESENYILFHIAELLKELGVCPVSWHEAHTRINEKKKLKLFFRGVCGNVVKKINAIRRSGHRGTSCLNWWTNYAMWYCSVFQKPHIFLDPAVRRGVDVLGNTRWFNGCFEGDDSLVTTSPKLVEDTEITNTILSFWDRAGFNMKFVFVEGRATFVGWHVAAEKGKLMRGMMAPELPRALRTNVSCSPSMKECAKAGDTSGAKTIAAAAILARAADFSGLLPTVSMKYQQYAASLVARDSTLTDRELSMRVTGEDEAITYATVHDMVDTANLGADPVKEAALLQALGLGATQDELLMFATHAWSWDALDDYDGFSASLPGSWK